MKISYMDDSQQGPGYGSLLASEANFPDASRWKLAIQRGSDHAYLAGETGQWRGEALFREFPGSLDESGNLKLALGPEVTDSLNPMEQYLVTLKDGNGETFKGRLCVASITYSKYASLDHTARVEMGDSVKKSAAVNKAATGEPVSVLNAESAASASTTPEAGARRALDGSLVMPRPENPVKHGTIPRWLLLAGLLVALLAWYFLDPGRWREESFSDQPKEAAKAEESASAREGKPQIPETSARSAVMDRVRDFFSQASPKPRAALELARNLAKNSPEERDAVYRLYYYAAENGVRDALLDYAACLDPSRPAWGTIRKDAPPAFEIYEKASAAGLEGAAEAQKQLLDWLRAQAARGDQEAAQWLRQIGK